LVRISSAHKVIKPIRQLDYKNKRKSIFNLSVDGSAEAFGAFSSGTTGKRKFILVNRRQEKLMAAHICSNVGNTTLDTEILLMPMSHSFGLGRMRSAIFAGTRIVIGYEFRNLKKLFSAIKAHHITGFGLVPTALRYILKLSGNMVSNYGPQLNYLELGSAQLSEDEKRSLKILLPDTEIYMHYGLTEVSRALFLNLKSDNLLATAKLGTGAKLKVVNESGVECENGVVGELFLNAPWQAHNLDCLGSGTSLCIEDEEYISTGDIGYISNGYMFFCGRNKDIINTGGKKFTPNEIEFSVAQNFPDLEVVVVGAPDELLGEKVLCFLVKVKNQTVVARLKNYIETQFPKYMHPTDYLMIDEIPKTKSGKIQKFKLIDRLS
jgi:acyl-CoA synthetase (AMP-forming)/AMP-acid ligase II